MAALNNNSALGDETEKDVMPWLKLAEDLRILKLDVDLNMPQICVMGDQSSGKSSVLEALSGIPFPRGAGLVTRCPIRMVMKRARAGENWCAKVSTSVDPAQTTVHDVPQLSIVLDRFMSDLCSGSSNFSTESIIIELVSPDACDLTVVDLPGIIRTVTAGQNVSVIEQVNRMIKSYLMDTRTIILAVIPANQDIATVDILERAQGVDPSGERTIGVLTKCDLISPGGEEEVMSVVNNIRKPLALGYVMVKNRSQRDITENVTTKKSADNEKAFFTTHSVFRKLNSDQFGVTTLSKKLTNLLVGRIKREMAPMRQTVEHQLADVRSQLRALPSSYASPATPADRQKLLVSIVQEYVRHLSDCIRGEYRDRIMVRHAELRMYTLALEKFEEFKASVNESAPLFKEREFIELLTSQIDQLRGRELPGFMSSQAFYMCMSQYVDTWQDPAVQLVRDVEQVAKEVSGHLADILLVQYPGLRYALESAVEKILMNSAEQTMDKLQECISREKDPFTLNDFLQQWVNKIRFDRFSNAVDSVFDNAKNPATNWSALKEEVYAGMRHWYRSTHSVSAQASAEDMSAIMEAYWHLAAKRFVDSCCMLADNDILGKLPSAVQDEMYQFIKDDSKLQLFFAENAEIKQHKIDIENLRDRLVQASAKLASIATAAPTPPPPTAATAAHKSQQKSAASPPEPQKQQQKQQQQPQQQPKSPAQPTKAPPAPTQQVREQLSFNVPLDTSGLKMVLTVTNVGTPTSSVHVKEFGANSPCEAVGIKIGDTVVAVNGAAVKDIDGVRGVLKEAKGAVQIQVLR